MNLHELTESVVLSWQIPGKDLEMEMNVPLSYLRTSNLFNVVKKGFLNEERALLAKTPKGSFVDVKMTEGKIRKNIVTEKGHQVTSTFSVHNDGLQLENVTELTPRGRVITRYENNKPVSGRLEHGSPFNGFVFGCNGKITEPNEVRGCGKFKGREMKGCITYENDKKSINTFKEALDFIRGNEAISAYK